KPTSRVNGMMAYRPLSDIPKRSSHSFAVCPASERKTQMTKPMPKSKVVLSPLSGDRTRAKQRIRNLAELAARSKLTVEKLNALNLTIAVYLPPKILKQLRAELKSEQRALKRAAITPRSRACGGHRKPSAR